MRLGTIFYLYRVRLRARLVQELLAVAGIAVGVALLFASQVANTSLSGSVSQLTNGLVGNARLQVTARSPLGFDQSLLEKVSSLPGVLAAVPVLQRSANLVGPKGSMSVDLIGVSPTFARLDSRMLQRVSQLQQHSQQGIALPAPVAERIGAGPLEPLQLQVGVRNQRTLTSAILQESDIGELVHSPIVIAPLGISQQLADMQGRINRLILEPRPGREAKVRRELNMLVAGRLNVTPADVDATIFEKAEAPASQSTTLFSIVSALVGFMFAFNAMLLTLPQRRNLISDLRLDGYSPLEIAEVVLFDAFILGVAGSAVGLLLGELLSSELLQANPGYLSFAFPVASVRIVTWQSVALACAGGILAASVGVAIPLRNDIFFRDISPRKRATKSSHIAKWAPMACVVAGLSVSGLLLASGISDVTIAILAFAALTFAMLASLPMVFRLAVEAFDLIQRPVRSVSPRVAVIELQSRSTRARSLAIAATGAIAVFGSVAIEGARHNLESGLDGVAQETTRATDIWVSPRGAANTLATTPFRASIARRLGGTKGVSAVRLYRGGFLDVGTRRMLVIAEPADSPLLLAPRQVSQAGVGAPRLIEGESWVALSKAAANELHLRIGQRFTLPTPSPYTFRLAAITTNFGWPPGALIMNAGDFARAWGSPEISAYQVNARAPSQVAAVEQRIQAALGPKSALVVQTGEQREKSYRKTLSQGLARLSDITALVLTAAVLAMAAAMGALIWQRRTRLAGMKVDGFDQRELWRALLYESAVLLGTGCSVGAVFGLGGQIVLTRALAGVTGFPVVLAVSGTIAIVTVTSVTLVAVVMVALPGYLASRVRPAIQD